MHPLIHQQASKQAEKLQVKPEAAIAAIERSKEQGRLFIETVVSQLNEQRADTNVAQLLKEGNAMVPNKLMWDHGFNTCLQLVISYLTK